MLKDKEKKNIQIPRYIILHVLTIVQCTHESGFFVLDWFRHGPIRQMFKVCGHIGLIGACLNVKWQIHVGSIKKGKNLNTSNVSF